MVEQNSEVWLPENETMKDKLRRHQQNFLAPYDPFNPDHNGAKLDDNTRDRGKGLPLVGSRNPMEQIFPDLLLELLGIKKKPEPFGNHEEIHPDTLTDPLLSPKTNVRRT